MKLGVSISEIVSRIQSIWRAMSVNSDTDLPFQGLLFGRNFEIEKLQQIEYFIFVCFKPCPFSHVVF